MPKNSFLFLLAPFLFSFLNYVLFVPVSVFRDELWMALFFWIERIILLISFTWEFFTNDLLTGRLKIQIVTGILTIYLIICLKRSHKRYRRNATSPQYDFAPDPSKFFNICEKVFPMFFICYRFIFFCVGRRLLASLLLIYCPLKR